MRPVHRGDTSDRLARIERMIEHYRLATRRRLLRRAKGSWRKVEAEAALVEFEKPLERIH